MPQAERALTRTVRGRVKRTGEKYTEAREHVLAIRELMDENEWTYAEAEAWYDSPANQLMCRDCGWTYGMVCPECTKGCGCQVGCTGWRHGEWAEDHDDPEAHDPEDYYVDCDECGGSYDFRTGYGCACKGS